MRDWTDWSDADADTRAENARLMRDAYGRNRLVCPVCGGNTVIVATVGSYAPEYGCSEVTTELDADCACEWTAEQYDALIDRAIEEEM